MKLYTLVALAILASNCAWSQLIPWKADTLLQWSDFQGAVDQSSPYKATTFYTIKNSMKSDATRKISATAKCYFDKNKSWKKTDSDLTPALLQHEQLHFNIAEIYTRKIRQAFNSYTSSHLHDANTSKDINKIFSDLLNDCARYNAAYDAETNHSINEEKQKEWNKKVMAELYALSAFELK